MKDLITLQKIVGVIWLMMGIVNLIFTIQFDVIYGWFFSGLLIGGGCICLIDVMTLKMEREISNLWRNAYKELIVKTNKILDGVDKHILKKELKGGRKKDGRRTRTKARTKVKRN